MREKKIVHNTILEINFNFFCTLNRTVTGLKKLKNETRSEIVIELVGPVCGAIILLVKFSHSTSC